MSYHDLNCDCNVFSICLPVARSLQEMTKNNGQGRRTAHTGMDLSHLPRMKRLAIT